MILETTLRNLLLTQRQVLRGNSFDIDSIKLNNLVRLTSDLIDLHKFNLG